MASSVACVPAEVAVAPGPSEFGRLPFERFIELEAAIVAAPRLADGSEPPRSLAELDGHTLLNVQSPDDLWRRWLNRAGGATPAAPPSLVFENLALMYEAAANGLGLALAIPTVADRYLEAGRLRPCMPVRAAVDADYNLIFASEAVRRRADVRAFTQWIKQQAERSRARFAELVGCGAESSRSLPPAA